MLKVSVIVPVYNEASTCNEVFRQLSEKKITGISFEFIIVESHSTDGSREIVEKFVRGRTDTLVIYEDMPRGKGSAVRLGLAVATGDVIMIQDADLEYDFNDYEKLLTPFLTGQNDIVLGSRHAGNSTLRMRYFGVTGIGTAAFINLGHILFTWIFNVLYDQKLADPATMFKIFRRDCIKGMTFSCSRFDFDFELICKIVRRGYTPVEIPVSYKSRGFVDGKKVKVFRDPPTWIRVLLRCRFIDSDPAVRGSLTDGRKKSSQKKSA